MEASSGSIEDDPSASITVAGAARFTAGTGLDLQTLEIAGPIALTINGNATLINNRATTFGSVVVDGNLNVIARGAIGQTAGGIMVDGTTLLNADGDINLINLGAVNNLVDQVTISSARNVSLRNNAPGAGAGSLFPILPIGLQDLALVFGDSELVLPELSITGDLDLSSSGNFSQGGILTVEGAGSSTITSTAGGVTLSQNSSFGGSLAVTSAGAIS